MHVSTIVPNTVPCTQSDNILKTHTIVVGFMFLHFLAKQILLNCQKSPLPERTTSEAQLAEEPLVLAGLVLLLELHAGLEAVGLSLDGVLQVLGGDLVEGDVRHAVAGGHQMVVVQDLAKG